MSSPVVRGGTLWGFSGQSNITHEEAIDPANPGGWVMVGDNESFRHWELDLGDRILRKTECKNSQKLLEDNQVAFNESEGKRWGNGQVVGSVPLNIFFQEGLGDATTQRDTRYIKKWWNDPDHRKFRRFKGKI